METIGIIGAVVMLLAIGFMVAEDTISIRRFRGNLKVGDRVTGYTKNLTEINGVVKRIGDDFVIIKTKYHEYSILKKDTYPRV